MWIYINIRYFKILQHRVWLSTSLTILSTAITRRYWQNVAEERKKKPARIMLADKNAPNGEVWSQSQLWYNICMCYACAYDQFKSIYKSDKIIHFQIENMCGTTKAAAVPVIPDSEGSTMFK
jgi:hypothetical protein